MQNDTVNIEQYTTAKIYLFQLRGPIMLCLYSRSPFSCIFFAYEYTFVGAPNSCSVLLRLYQGMSKVNGFMLKCFKMIFQRLEV